MAFNAVPHEFKTPHGPKIVAAAGVVLNFGAAYAWGLPGVLMVGTLASAAYFV